MENVNALTIFSNTYRLQRKKDGESSKSEKFQSDYIDISGRDIKVNGGFFSAIHGMSYFTDFKTNTAVPIMQYHIGTHKEIYN